MHKLHKVYCQVVYVTFDISVTKKIKCSLAGAYNGKMGGESVTCTGSTKNKFL
jgi:hypothetical protein